MKPSDIIKDIMVTTQSQADGSLRFEAELRIRFQSIVPEHLQPKDTLRAEFKKEHRRLLRAGINDQLYGITLQRLYELHSDVLHCISPEKYDHINNKFKSLIDSLRFKDGE
jgi:hypothetical protein